ncbi:hypothetical protein GCM10009837_07260 [Streptomyces durmitorensis]|uniref:Uncharacterized protein n=1 Tax=Streptomyces durmitorensis TaxID=319947 RepID=A0ABY4PMV1_9ACTN|nr:hypothetical protein [Streptomyces durmitorensis]UQT54381.1 hypothetical protein M4V62_04360 [Streptomyces durmitorensis]
MGLFSRSRPNDAFEPPEEGGYPVTDPHGNVSSWHDSKAAAKDEAQRLNKAMDAANKRR